MFETVISDIRKVFKPEPIDHRVNDRAYKVVQTDNGPQLGDLIVPPTTPTLNLGSLSGFVDAYLARIDTFPVAASAIHVCDESTVALVSLAGDEYGRRQVWLKAKNGEANPFPFDTYQTPEMFLIHLQAGFLPTDNVVSLQRLASSLSSENSIGVADDGLAQTVTVKQGAVTREAIALPARLPLFTYRTFREVDPIKGEFMLRLKGKQGELPQIALLQIDAGKWKHDTQIAIAHWLKKRLPEAVVIA